MKQKKLISAVMSLVALLAFAQERQEYTGEMSINKTVYPEEIISNPKRVTPAEFIIFPWGDMPANPAGGSWGDFANMDSMMMCDLYKCGFNTSGFIEPQLLRHARANHLMGILKYGVKPDDHTTPEAANDSIKKLFASITDAQDRRAVFAVNLCDEPNVSLFPQLKIWSEAVKKQSEEVMGQPVLPYINLFPDYATSQQLGAQHYEAYLDLYTKTCQPPFISYDNYSLFNDGQLDEDRFYGNLESVRNKSLHDSIPFWNVILSNAHFNYAEPSVATLAVQVYSTLAYGGKGIGYFTYYTPQIGNYRLAPVDRFGFRTDTWEMMRYINLQIHALVPELNRLTNVNVFHTGQLPRNCQDITSRKHIARINIKDSLLISEFEDDEGRPYALIVNKNVQSSVALDFAFRKYYQDREDTIMVISQFEQGKQVYFSKGNNWVPPGCGVLVTIKKLLWGDIQ